MTAGMTCRPMAAGDADDVLRIYREGIDSGHATFAPAVPDWAGWDEAHLPHSRLVAVTAGRIVGWAALIPVSSRPVYRGVTELSIYVSTEARRSGVGRALMEALIEVSEAAGIWTLQAGIFPENAASIALHETYGFRIVGTRERVGKMEYGPMAGRWRDVVLMERRSTVAGVD